MSFWCVCIFPHTNQISKLYFLYLIPKRKNIEKKCWAALKIGIFMP